MDRNGQTVGGSLLLKFLTAVLESDRTVLDNLVSSAGWHRDSLSEGWELSAAVGCIKLCLQVYF